MSIAKLNKRNFMDLYKQASKAAKSETDIEMVWMDGFIAGRELVIQELFRQNKEGTITLQQLETIVTKVITDNSQE